jgi:nitrous oxide reductase
VKASLEVRSIRLPSGEELLLACVTAANGAVGWGITFTLDATAARHMAEQHAGFRVGEPDYLSTPA